MRRRGAAGLRQAAGGDSGDRRRTGGGCGDALEYQIRNSNSYSLAAQVRTAGGEPEILRIVRDDKAATERAIREAESCDLVLLTGGVRWEFDFVEQALVLWERISSLRGAHPAGEAGGFRKTGEQLLLRVAGNPVSTM